ncbi:ATP-binding protein [Streptomyces sp. SID7909]|uniref:ATP-binding protein n=1 Tax=Streptomyces sp. SID7909 TaxID=2706092 RepID=UPI001944EB2C|nr:ATP-binding protein [Streptomyces sp. SID7909]
MEQLVAHNGGAPGRQIGAEVVRGSAAYEMTSAEIAGARAFVRDFVHEGRVLHAWEVSDRAVDVAQLVVSALATNVCKYAPGPCLLDLESDGETLNIAMWDSGAAFPTASAADPTRIGSHGLELVLVVCQSFEVRREPVGKRLSVGIALQDAPDRSPHGHTSW